MNKEKTASRKEKALETKKKIYTSANRLFKQYGFEKVSVDSIVEMAGVSKGSFYVHFESKNALIAALSVDFVKQLDLDYKFYLESFPAGTSASDILTALVDKITDVITNTVGYDIMKVIYKVQITKTINTDAILGYDRDLYKIFSAIINQGVQQGEFKTELTVDTITKHLIMAIRGITYEWCVRYPDFNLKDQTLKHFRILLTGIKMHP